MTNLVDINTYKKEAALKSILESVRKVAATQLEWRFRSRALESMREHSLMAPDVLSIFSTAFEVDVFSSPGTFIISGYSADGHVYCIAVCFSENSNSLKILKCWKNSKISQQTA
jgi:hypothetical protein